MACRNLSNLPLASHAPTDPEEVLLPATCTLSRNKRPVGFDNLQACTTKSIFPWQMMPLELPETIHFNNGCEINFCLDINLQVRSQEFSRCVRGGGERKGGVSQKLPKYPQ